LEAVPNLINDYNEATCINFFRFQKNDLQELATLLWPRIQTHLNGNYDQIICINQYSIPFESGLLILLYRFSQPNRIRPNMEKFFCIQKSKLSAIILTFTNAMFEVANQYLSNPQIFLNRWEFLSEVVRNKSNGAVPSVWGFIDGTLRKTCQPSMFQRLAYSGHKRCHGIKFQSVVTPDGIIAMMYGPIAGSRHDSFILGQSNLIQQLREIIPVNADGIPAYQLYGDPAYPQSGVLFGGFRLVRQGTIQAAWNTEMSRVQESVEWLFKEIIVQWSFLDFKSSMKFSYLQLVSTMLLVLF
jgi:nuclease HARBI1